MKREPRHIRIVEVIGATVWECPVCNKRVYPNDDRLCKFKDGRWAVFCVNCSAFLHIPRY